MNIYEYLEVIEQKKTSVNILGHYPGIQML